ncbi:MAG: hypothetical protein HYX54_04795 [Chloroflexi bacterium]|nr:hypothetical protein [Chloroflexota bacterium]
MSDASTTSGSEPKPPSPRPPTRSPLRLVLAAAMVLAGAIWMLQGLGVLRAGDSFMIGDPTWTVIGGAFVIVGGITAFRARR